MTMFKAFKSETFEWIKAIVIALILAILIRSFLFAPIIVKGESMFPTLQNSEQMIVNKIGYTFSKPERFDIIVFHANEEQDYIKRIIGLPGDHIEYIDDENYSTYYEPNKNEGNLALIVRDYIAGMSDKYFHEVYNQLKKK